MTAYLAELQARLAGQPTAAIPSSGRNIPFGAAVLSNGINFSVFSRHASRVELLLFDDAEERRPTRANDPRNSCRPTLRLSRYWAVRTRARPRFRSEQGSARPIWACCCRARRIFSPDGKRIRGERCDCDEKRSGRPQQLRLGGRCSIAAPHRQHCHLWDACRWFHATSEFKRCLGAARDLFRWGARPNTASRHASSLCWFREPATFPFQRKTSRQQTSRLTLTYQPTNPAKEHECSGIE